MTIITNISFDHTKQLGDTLAAIAAEKAGIIKPGVPVISGVDGDEPREVIRRIARQNGCRLVESGVDFHFDYRPPHHLEQESSPARFYFQYVTPARDPEERNENSRGLIAPGEPANPHRELLAPGYFADVALGLLGRHQAANAAVALAAVEELRRSGWVIPEAAIRRGLAEVAWPARVEVVARRPTVVLDAAHNVASIAALVEVLDESFSANRRLLIFATTQEKDHCGMLQRLLGRFDHVIFTRYSNNPRSVPPEALLELARRISSLPTNLQSVPGDGPGVRATTEGDGGDCREESDKRITFSRQPPPSPSLRERFRATTMEIIATPAEAWDAARRMATPNDLICIAGSFFLASEMRIQIAARPFPTS